MKKFLALVTAVSLVLTLASVAMAGFDDAPKSDHWVYDNFMLVYNSGLLKGYPDGTFKGQRYATRYEMVELTGRVLTYIESKVASGAGGGLNANQVRALIREELGLDAGEADELYTAIQELQKEFRDELLQQGVRITLLEQTVEANTEEIAALKEEMKEIRGGSAAEAMKQAKSAKIMAIIGIILGIAGIVVGG
ncbi:MAG TPA: S-layer homology domain-containing protein [Bacillota bacterium]